ncbi:MAG: hypothetical protein U0326_30900 [Polyangiales bacterium]
MPLRLPFPVALIALFMPVDLVDARSGIGVTAASPGRSSSRGGHDPHVATTVADALFIVAYAVTALALVISVGAYRLRHGTATDFPRRAGSTSRGATASP